MKINKENKSMHKKREEEANQNLKEQKILKWGIKQTHTTKLDKEKIWENKGKWNEIN